MSKDILTSENLVEVQRLVEEVGEVLHGQPEQIQGAVLADLVATFIASHFGATKVQTERIRKRVIDLHLYTVKKLIRPNEAMILERVRERAS